MEDMVVEGNKTLIDVFLNAVDASHVEGGPVLTRPVALFQQVSAMHVSRRLALGVVEDPIELIEGVDRCLWVGNSSVRQIGYISSKSTAPSG